jgi:hypothetical protein
MQICQNALSLAQEREFMRRKRFQKGSIRPRKHGKTRVWVGQWWERGQKKSKVLGRVAEMPKSEAEAQISIILKPLTRKQAALKSPSIHSPSIWRKCFFRYAGGNGKSPPE